MGYLMKCMPAFPHVFLRVKIIFSSLYSTSILVIPIEVQCAIFIKVHIGFVLNVYVVHITLYQCPGEIAIIAFCRDIKGKTTDDINDVESDMFCVSVECKAAFTAETFAADREVELQIYIRYTQL
jgi:hypothetical protein